MTFTSSPIGNLISCSLFDLSDTLLSDHNLLTSKSKEALAKDNFTVISTLKHEFSPQGFTLVFLLAESHFALHTYPEYNSLSITLYSCRGEKDGMLAITSFLASLGCTHYTINEQPVVVGPLD